MTWKSHRVLTGFSVLLYTHNVFAALAAVVGSTFPDMAEMAIPGRWSWYHRKFTHWFVPYLVLLVAMEWLFPFALGGHRFHLFFYWFLVGCLAHIAEDAVCGKIPVWHPDRPVWVCPRLFYAGSPTEYVFVGLGMAFVVLTAWLAAKL